MNLEKICSQTIELVMQAAEYIKKEYNAEGNRGMEEKGKHNYVTRVDKNTEEMLVRGLETILPDAGFIGEEGSYETDRNGLNWVIDPLDGTTNFIHGAYPFAISVGLIQKGKPILGVIQEIGLNECFYGWKNGGAYLDGKPIRVSKNMTLNESLIATGFPYTNYKYLDGFMASIEWFMKHSRGLRRLGSAATDIAWVACGRYDGFYEYGLNPWDIAAGVIILDEAGGQTTDFEGGDDFLFGEEVICSNRAIHNEFTDAVNNVVKQHG